MYNQIASNKRKSWLLLFLTVVILAGLGYLLGEITQYGPGLSVGVFFAALLLNGVGYFAGDKIALAASGAREIQKADSPYVFNMVENLCITAGLPMPRIYIIDDPALNAFATGRKPELASIAITTGLINALENEELEGVIAHELSHIQNYDIRFMTLVVVCIGAIAMLADVLLRAGFFSNRDREENKGAGLLMIVGIVLAILSPIIGQLIQLAISRKREFLADASGALLTRYPDGLANALAKIGANDRPMQHANHATAHLFFSTPFGNTKGMMNRLFSTHPPIEERIAALRGMTAPQS